MSSIVSIATPVRPDLAQAARVVGVKAQLRRQVERHRQPRRALRRAGSGSARWTPSPTRTRRTGASSTVCLRYISRCTPRVYGNSPGSPRSSCSRQVGLRVQLGDLDARVGEAARIVRARRSARRRARSSLTPCHRSWTARRWSAPRADRERARALPAPRRHGYPPAHVDLPGHRRRRLPRLAPLRRAARARQPRDLRRQPRDRARWPTSRTSATRALRVPATSTSSSRTSSTSPSTSSTTSPRPASPIDYLRLPLHTLKVGSYGTHHTLGLAKAKRARFLIGLDQRGLRRPARAPAVARATGATSTRSARAASTTRPSATPRR